MASCEKDISKYKAGSRVQTSDVLVIEEPLQISVSGSFLKNNTGRKNIAVTMRTPGADEVLAAGFLYSEGLLSKASQIINTTTEENKINFDLASSEIDLSSLHRNFYTTSSCGVCGKASIEAISFTKEVPTTINRFQVDSQLIYTLPAKARASQELFHKTGGIHAATLFDTSGNIVTQYEDVGRHNAFDKVIGDAFLKNSMPLDNHVLLLSGRASFELLQKAIMAGIQLVVAIGAPSSLAVELAEEYDVTLVGFLKKESFNVYNGEHRIVVS